jgi:glycerate 2-kinase
LNAQDFLLGSFRAAIAAADPQVIVPPRLPMPPRGRTLVVGAGKAAAAMARAVEQHWPASARLDGLVITRYAHGVPTERIRVIEAGHPVPDEAGETAAAEILARTADLGADDLLLALVSGGGSSLLSLPVEGVSMADLKATTRELLRCGAPIQAMNTVRKHISRIQGGRLAAASKAPVVALIISDVTGDDPSHIGSGPCTPDPTTYQDALDIFHRFGVDAPPSVVAHLTRGARGDVAETPKPGDPAFARVQNRVIATAQHSLAAAATWLETQGFASAILGDSVTGEAAEVAKVYAALVRQVAEHGSPFRAPIALISGGECTVTIPAGMQPGRGGRCAEFLLSLGVELDSMPGVAALACDTDGIDGSEDNAGAILLPDSLQRAAGLGLKASAYLAAHDSYSWFAALGNLVVTGPTRTNINDYRVILMGNPG